MTSQEYCVRLQKALSAMPPSERQETVRYYMEFLEDAGEEERAALGTPEQLAARILQENGIFPQPQQKSNRIGRIVLLACTFYIWLPLLLTWYILLLTAIICLFCVPISLAIGFLSCLFVGIIAIRDDWVVALLLTGIALFGAGLAILTAKPVWIACKAICKFSVRSTKKLWQFVRGEKSA